MRTHASGKFEVKSWDEKPYEQIEGGGKLTRASVTQSFEGDLVGKGEVDFLMMYPTDKTANFVGLQRVTGSMGGRTGSFVLQCSGVFEGGTARCTWFVVPGSGTGQLRGLRGEGGYAAKHEDYPYTPFTLEYDIE